MTPIPRYILLIDDDPLNAKVILETLVTSSEDSYQVDWIRLCSEGLAKLPAPDAVLLDLSLSDSRGIETFDRFYAAAPYIPILILTKSIINPLLFERSSMKGPTSGWVWGEFSTTGDGNRATGVFCR